MARHRSYYQVSDFRPFLTHPEKFLNPDNKSLVARSGLEMRIFQKIDNLSSVIKWSSEKIFVPYQKPLFRNSKDSDIIKTEEHKYIVDAWLLWQNPQGEVIEMLIEIKPKQLCYPPKQPKIDNKKSWENYHTSMQTYLINKCKWLATSTFCKNITEAKQRPIHFVIFTENEIILANKVLGI